MTCPKISRTWFGFQLSIRITDHPISDFKDCLRHAIQNMEEHNIIQVAALIYNIWHVRNLIIF